MRIYLLRHAQSRWQVEPDDNLDSELTDLGHRQARATADWLADLGNFEISTFKSLHTSPLVRARQTAAHIAQPLGLPIHEIAGLREADFHIASHLPTSADPRKPPEGRPTSRYRGYRKQVELTLSCLMDCAEEDGGQLLAVTHGGFIKTTLRIIAGSDAFCATLYNSCLNAVEWRRGRWHILHLNMWSHLGSDMRTT